MFCKVAKSLFILSLLSFIAEFIVKIHLLQLDKKVHKYRITMFIPSSLQYFCIVLTNYWSIKCLCNFLSIVLLFFYTLTCILANVKHTHVQKRNVWLRPFASKYLDQIIEFLSIYLQKIDWLWLNRKHNFKSMLKMNNT